MRHTFLVLALSALLPDTSAAEIGRRVDSIVFSIHVDVAAQLDLETLREHLESVRAWAESSRGADDVSCCTEIQAISLEVFGTPGDGLDVIDSESKWNQLGSRKAFVQDIAWCDGPISTCGCGTIGGDKFAVSVLENECFVPYVIAHERLHNAGLTHGNPCSFMDSGASCFTVQECNAFRALGSNAGICGCLGSSVGDPPLDDGTSCSQEVAGGRCAWSGLCLEDPVESPFDGPAPLQTNAASDSGDDVYPALATAGGTWVAAWSSFDSLGGTIGTDLDILFARSSDEGATWAPPLALNTNATSDVGHDWAPRLATDGRGTWVAVWFSDVIPEILVASSMDDGVSWTPPQALNSTATLGNGNWYPDVAADDQGTWIAVWGSFDSLDDTIGSDQDILTARSLDAGLSWTPSSVLNTNASTDSGGDWYPRLETDGQGTWVAVWTSNDTLDDTIGPDWDILVARSMDAGLTWTPPAPLNSTAGSDTGQDVGPKLTTDGHGTWIAVWSSSEDLEGVIGSDYDILMARSLDGGVTWTPPAVLNADAGSDTRGDSRVQLAVDGRSQWVSVWNSADTLGGTVGTDWDILVARSLDGGITWTPPEVVHGNAVADAYPDHRPQLAMDAQGRWVAIWQSYDALGDYLGGSIGRDYDILRALPEPGLALQLLIGIAMLPLLLRRRSRRRARRNANPGRNA